MKLDFVGALRLKPEALYHAEFPAAQAHVRNAVNESDDIIHVKLR